MPGRFVLAAMPLTGLVMGEFVLGHPHVRVDAVQVSESWSGTTRTICLVQGATAADLDELERRLLQRYGNAQRTAAADHARFLVAIDPKDVASEVFRSISRFAADGALWWHAMTEAGHQMRVRVDGPDAAFALRDRLAAFYRKMGLNVQAEVGPLPPGEELALARVEDAARDLPKASGRRPAA